MKSYSLARHLYLTLIGLIWASLLYAAEANRDREADTARLRELKEVLWPKAY